MFGPFERLEAFVLYKETKIRKAKNRPRDPLPHSQVE